MRTVFTLIFTTLFMGATCTAFADDVESVKGGFELSAVINTGLGMQFNNPNSQSGGAPVFNSGAAANPYGPVGPGPLGEFNQYNVGPNGLPAGYAHYAFEFYTDGVQLSLSKRFGENILSRVDLVFGNAAYGSSTSYLNTNGIAQAYVTANIPAGNGLELLVGTAFVPFGYEKVFRNENNSPTHSIIWSLRPTTLTGAKLYYAFNELLDLHFYVYNNMRNNMSAAVSKDMPGYGVTLGFNWGDDGKMSRVDVTGLAGPESWGNTTGGAGDKMGHWTYLGDVSWNWHASEHFVFGGEGLYRMDRDQKGGVNSRIFGAFLNLCYAHSMKWNTVFKFAYAHQNDVSGSISTVEALAAPSSGLLNQNGFRTNVLQGSFGSEHYIADGAKLQMEFRVDYAKSASNAVAAPGNTFSYGPIFNFAYAF